MSKWRSGAVLNGGSGWVAFVLALSALPASAQSTLWVTDDVTKNVYEIAHTGVLLSAFKNPPGGNSEVAVDGTAGSLWVVAEGAATEPGVVFQVSETGDVLSTFSAAVYGGFEPEGVVVDESDDTLWIVEDDQTIPALGVFHVDKAGGFISFFPTSSFDPNAVSPQGIALDPVSDTLWIADNATSRLYNVSKDGVLINSFSTMMFAPGFINPQGVSVSPDGSLWVTARVTATLYNITTSGVLISSLPSSIFDPLSVDPTGIAVALDGPPVFRAAFDPLLGGPPTLVLLPAVWRYALGAALPDRGQGRRSKRAP